MKEKQKQERSTVWGRAVIPLTPGGEAGWCYYSDAIYHELGDGLLWIDFALEQPDGAIVYGSTAPFDECEYMEETIQAEVGVLLNRDRKSFRIGVKLLKDTEQKEAVVCWRAGRIRRAEAERRFVGEEKKLLDYYMTARRSEAEIPVVSDPEAFYITSTPKYLYRGQKFMFTCRLPEGEKGPVYWRVLGDDGGTIDSFGMYTAPQRQGVFQVEASLGDPARYKTTVYVMIKE